MRIGIITFHASLNYGSALQAFALQEYLRARGHEAVIIDYSSPAQRRLYPAPVSFSSVYNAKKSLRRILSGWDELRFMDRKRKAFGTFRKNHMQLTDTSFRKERDLENYDWSSFDMLVSGSDQIWNPSAIDFSTAYFLDFLHGPGAPRKVAYAPSSGPLHGSVPPVCSIPGASHALSEYEAISVREKGTAEMLEKSGLIPSSETGGIPVMPDPVLLHDAEFYRQVFPVDPVRSGVYMNEPYLLFYTPGRQNIQAEMLADAVSAGMMLKSGAGILPESDRMRIVRVTDGASAGQESLRESPHDIVLPCGPDEFTSLVDKAFCCVGTSFHLMVFSMLFGKDFWCSDAASDSRKAQLLNSSGLSAETSFFRFSDPEVHSRVMACIRNLRRSADEFWKRLGV